MKLTQYAYVLILMSCPVRSAVIHVPGSYPTIQAGIDAAVNGDTVLVADGTYSGDGNRNIELRGKILTVMSQNGPANCVINFEDSSNYYEKGFYCHQDETNLTTIRGFAFTNSSGSFSYGIACYESSPIISNCVFADCFGVGLYMFRCDSRVSDCIFSSNGSYIGDSGVIELFDSDVEILNCEVNANSSFYGGGGIDADGGKVTITDTEIIGNSTIYSSGGGICSNNCDLTLSGCTIQGNIASESGGGVYSRGGDLTISGCTIQGNRAFDSGGGVYHTSTLIMTSCLIEDNHAQFGGGVLCEKSFADSVYGGSAETGNTFRNNVAAMGADLCAPSVMSPMNAKYNVFSGYHPSDYYVSPADAFDLTGCTSEMIPILQDVYVSSEGSDSNDGLTPESPFKTIRKAVNSVYGTETNPVSVHLLPGIYASTQNGEEFPLPLMNHVNFRGADALSVFISAEQKSRVFFGYKDTVTLSGITVYDGKTEYIGDGPFPYDGGGIFAMESSIVMDGCIVIGNKAELDTIRTYGGGLALNDSSLEMTDCILYGNYASGDGGGLYFSVYDRTNVEMVLTDTQIIGNVTDEAGGGLCFSYSTSGTFQGSLELTGCTISGNIADSLGGGMIAKPYFTVNDPMRISQCTFSDNQSGYSGGGICTFLDCIITETRISENQALDSGGAIFCWPVSRFELNNCLVTGNNSPSAVVYGNFKTAWLSNSIYTFVNTSFADNTVTGSETGTVHLITEEDVVVSLTHCILWNRTPAEITLDTHEGGSVDVTYSCIRNGYPGVGNFQFNPGFIGGGDYHLKPDSACVDTGTDVGFPETDIDGNARPAGGTSDIGAYEYPGWPDALRIYVDMPGHEIMSWDPFWVALDIWNPHAQSPEGLPLFVILDLHGEYFFAPAFNNYDFYLPVLSEGLSKFEVIPEINWPSGIGSVNGVLWIAALTDPNVTSILSNMAVYSFGWHD